MASEWSELTLDDLIEIKHGFAFKGEFFSDMPHGDILLTPGNFAVGGGFKADKFKYYDGPEVPEYCLREGELLVTMTDLSKQADTLGYPAFVPSRSDGRRYLHNQRLGRVLVNDETKVSTRYLYYLMCCRWYRDEILASATGTTVKHTSPERIKRFCFQLPPLEQQCAIAHILGTLDDKIGLIQRMNETLEDITRAVFKSWFVDFDPVRAKADGCQPAGMDAETAALFPDSFEDSVVGRVPQGWQVKCLKDSCEIGIGGDWGKEASFDGAIEVACLRGLDLEHLRGTGWAKVPRRWVKRISLEKRALTECDVLIAASGLGPLGRPLWVSQSLQEAFEVTVIYSNFCKRLHCSSPEYATFIDRVLLNMRTNGEVWEYATGTSIPNLDVQGLLAGRLIAFPSDSLISKFHTLLDCVYHKLYSRESRTLVEIRDTLLPKLISGEIRVKDAERFVEEHAG